MNEEQQNIILSENTSEIFKFALAGLEEALRDTEDPTKIIDSILNNSIEYYGADRAYILEVDWDLGIFVNTYEVCRLGIQSQIQRLQSIPFERVIGLKRALEKNKPIVLPQVKRLEVNHYYEYELLHNLEIHSFLAAPLKKSYNNGFLCIDNPTKYQNAPEYLLILAYAIVAELNEITLRKMVETYQRNIPVHSANDVYINCFGRLEVITPQGSLYEKDFNADLAYTLFIYLVINHKKHFTAQDVLDSIWEGGQVSEPYSQIKNVVHRLRKTLDIINMKSLVSASHGTFILNPEYNIHTDIERFEHVCNRLENERIQDPTLLNTLYQEAIKLYKGNLSPRTDYYHWLIPKNIYFRNRYLQMIHSYIDLLMKQKAYLQLQCVASDALAFNPEDGYLHFNMILSLVKQDNLYLAKLHYQTAEKYLSTSQLEVLRSYF